MSIVKRLALILISLLLTVGYAYRNDGRVLSVRMFIHYLVGTGTPMEVVLPKKVGCQPTFVSKKRVAFTLSAYHTPYQNAVGRFGCEYVDGKLVRSWDTYDFDYANDTRICDRIRDPQHGHSIASNVGRCIVGYGYGKPFEVTIKVK
jgi:hypothetical protein